MTGEMIAGILIYFFIGYMIADTFLVKVNTAYWLTCLFYPIMIMLFFLVLLLLMLVIKAYELKGWLLNEHRT